MKKTERKVLISIMALSAIAFVSLCVFVVYQNASADNYNTTDSKVISKTQTVPTIEGLLEQVNSRRSKAGLSSLELDTKLNFSAQQKSNDMYQFKYFAHKSPSDSKEGYEYASEAMGGECAYVGENILRNDTDNNSVKSVERWMSSKPHREAILDPKYTLTGFGISDTYIVEHFCEKRN